MISKINKYGNMLKHITIALVFSVSTVLGLNIDEAFEILKIKPLSISDDGRDFFSKKYWFETRSFTGRRTDGIIEYLNKLTKDVKGEKDDPVNSLIQTIKDIKPKDIKPKDIKPKGKIFYENELRQKIAFLRDLKQNFVDALEEAKTKKGWFGENRKIAKVQDLNTKLGYTNIGLENDKDDKTLFGAINGAIERLEIGRYWIFNKFSRFKNFAYDKRSEITKYLILASMFYVGAFLGKKFGDRKAAGWKTKWTAAPWDLVFGKATDFIGNKIKRGNKK